MKKFFIVFIFIANLFANEVYILPKDSEILKEKIRYEILTAKESIFLAMYNFSYSKIAKELIKASQNGVKITVLLDKRKVEDNDKIFELLNEAKIKTVFADDIKKMHLKTMLIDEKLALIGSMNFTKKSFEENYDLVYFSKERNLVQKLKELKRKFD